MATSGELGHSDVQKHSTPTHIDTLPSSSPIVAIAAGGHHSLFATRSRIGQWKRMLAEARAAYAGRQSESLRVFVGSWNVNNQSPGENIAPWIHPQVPEHGDGNFDLIAIALQEIDLRAGALLTQTTPRGKEWADHVHRCAMLAYLNRLRRVSLSRKPTCPSRSLPRWHCCVWPNWISARMPTATI
jgi:hypothetical protein